MLSELDSLEKKRSYTIETIAADNKGSYFSNFNENKPLDLIQPYRLEMGIKLKVRSNKNLYEFWNKKISLKLNEELKPQIMELNPLFQIY